MAIAVLITRLLPLETEVGAATRLGACIAVGAVVYPALCFLLVANEVLAELRSALRKTIATGRCRGLGDASRPYGWCKTRSKTPASSSASDA